MAVQVGAHCLEREQGGVGILLGGVPSVHRGRWSCLAVASPAPTPRGMAVGLEASVTIIEQVNSSARRTRSPVRRSRHHVVRDHRVDRTGCSDADLVIGAVWCLAPPPRSCFAQMVRKMRPGSVLVDIAIDQGGCFETSRPTSHSDPTCTSRKVSCTIALPTCRVRCRGPRRMRWTNATLPLVLALADKGWRQRCWHPYLRDGLNVYDRRVTHPSVAQAFACITRSRRRS